MDKSMIEQRAIEKLAEILHSSGVSAQLVPRSKDYNTWCDFRLKVAKEIHDRLTDNQK